MVVSRMKLYGVILVANNVLMSKTIWKVNHMKLDFNFREKLNVWKAVNDNHRTSERKTGFHWTRKKRIESKFKTSMCHGLLGSDTRKLQEKWRDYQ